MDSAEATPKHAYPRIDRLLSQATRRLRGARIRAALGAGLLFSGTWALATALIGKGLGLPGGLWLLGLPPLVAALVAALWRTPDAAHTAAALQFTDPALRSALRSAVELRALGPSEPGRAPSAELIAAHAAATAGKLGDLDAAHLLPAKTARWLFTLGVTLALLDAFFAAFGPPRLIAAFGTLAAAPAKQRGEAAREPITGDIELTYLYPAHTRLASRTVSGTDGSITAPVGTEVRLRTRADRDVAAAAVVVDGQPTALTVEGARGLSGSILCRKAGSYFFRFQDGRGRVLAEGAPIPIVLQADAPPQISIESPATELEVDPKALVPIRYHADDDYGLSEIALVYRAPGSEHDSRVVVQQTPESPRHFSGDATFDLKSLQLAPGDAVTYTLEALDNDAVAGPKSGRALSHRLKIFSEAEHHQEAIRRAHELWEKLIALLGDRIDERTSPTPTAAGDGADTHALAVCDEMEQVARLLQKDRASPVALPTALLNIARGERARASATLDAREYSSSRRASGADPHFLRPLQNALDKEIGELERDVLYLESMLDLQITKDMLALSRELKSRRRELADMIEKYRKTPTPQLKAAIAAQIARLQERLNELLARMGELARGLSDEHLNRQAVEEISKDKDLAGDLDKAKRSLAEGNVDDALKALDAMANALDAMQGKLEAAAGEAGQKNPELARKVEALSKDLEKVTDEEKKLAGDTEQVRQRYRKALEQRAPAPPSLLAKLKEQVAMAKSQLDQIPDKALPQGLFGEDPLGTTRDKVAELGRALDVKDLDQALHSADLAVVGAQEVESGLGREAEIARAYGGAPADDPTGAEKLAQAHGHAQAAVPPLEQVRAELAKLFPDQDRLLSPADRKRMGELSQRQAQLRDQLGQVEKDIQDVQQSAPLFDPSAGKKVEQAGNEMRGAQHSLNGRQPSKAVEQEQGAVEQLDGLAQSMKKMARGGGPGEGQPFPMPFASDDGETGQGGEGLSPDHEKVVIPGADQYRVPAEFRRDILDAMRQKAPQQYEDQVKKYYQEIVR